MTENVSWNVAKVTRDARRVKNGHPSLCLWFTGISGAGKSTLATLIEQELHERGMHTYLLDGDNLRHGLNSDLGFTQAHRQENVRRVAEVAKLFVDAGVIVLSALISPFRENREFARSLFDDGSFIEIYVECPVKVCAERDPKGLYEKAQSGVITNFTGVSSPYEAPLRPEITLHTGQATIEECVAEVMQYLDGNIFTNAKG